MANVMIKCPVTNNYVPTGMDAEPESFQTMMGHGNESQCRDCGAMHGWDDVDTVLDN